MPTFLAITHILLPTFGAKLHIFQQIHTNRIAHNKETAIKMYQTFKVDTENDGIRPEKWLS